MKKILITFLLLITFQLVQSQNYMLDVYLMSECEMINNKLKCDEREVSYQISVNGTLNWFFIFQNNPDKSLTKLIEMNVVKTYELSNHMWSYDLLSENNYSYVFLIDFKKNVAILTPLLKLNEELTFESIFFEFYSQTKI